MRGIRGVHGFGSVIQVRPVRGLGQLNNPRSAVGAAMPIVLGGGTALVTALGITAFMKPTTEGQMAVVKNAPWIGMGAGVLTSLALMNMVGQPAGIAAFVGTAAVGATMLLPDAIAKMRTAALTSGGTAGFRGLRAVVPEYSLRGLPAGGVGRLGAVALEPIADRGYGAGPVGSYGETVQLGQINAGAFGTPTFTLGQMYGGRFGRRRR